MFVTNGINKNRAKKIMAMFFRRGRQNYHPPDAT